MKRERRPEGRHPELIRDQRNEDQISGYAVETAARSAAVAQLLACAHSGRIELDPALVASLARLAARAALWAARTAELSEVA